MATVVIDAHTHVFPPKVAEKATAGIGAFYGLELDSHPGTPAELLRQGNKHGVAMFLICSVATRPQQVGPINGFIAETVRAWPKRFVGLGTLHPASPDPAATVADIVKHGLSGVKLHADLQRFDIDAPEMMPVYRAIAKAGLPVLMHMGDERYDYSRPHRLANVLRAVPGLRCIAAHMGGYRRWEEAEEHLLGYDNLYFDCSSSLSFMPPARARDLIEKFGEERVLFGTDFPMWQYREEYARVEAMGLTHAQREKLFYKNFCALFDIPHAVPESFYRGGSRAAQ